MVTLSDGYAAIVMGLDQEVPLGTVPSCESTVFIDPV
jgi:hypothetical protein